LKHLGDAAGAGIVSFLKRTLRTYVPRRCRSSLHNDLYASGMCGAAARIVAASIG
jgi:hypothetical protein